MSETTPPADRRLHDVTTLVSSMLIAFPMLISGFVKAMLFAGNPADVDITNDLAYLREILGFGFGSLGVIVVAIAVLLVIGYRRARSVAALRLPLVVLALQIVVGVVILLFTGLSNGSVNSYTG